MIGLLLMLPIGCNQATTEMTETTETTAVSLPDGASLVTLDLPGMT